MTDEQIMKALEWHSNDETHCSACPYEEHSVTHYCVDMVMKDALDLINRQKAKIERLEGKVKRKEFIINKLKTGSNAYVSLTSDSAEAIKEFAEKMKGVIPETDDTYIERIVEDYIDNLVKEMVGEG